MLSFARFPEFALFVSARFNNDRRRFGCMYLLHHLELSLSYSPQPGKKLCLLFSKIFLRDFVQFEAHLQFEQLLFDYSVVVKLLIDNLLNLAQDEFEAAYGKKQQVVYQEHSVFTLAPLRTGLRRVRVSSVCVRNCTAARDR